jgi:hypothetical protein
VQHVFARDQIKGSFRRPIDRIGAQWPTATLPVSR